MVFWIQMKSGRFGMIDIGFMTKEQTTKAIKVMQAYLDGKTIQMRGTASEWIDCSGAPAWDFFRYNYRIKPESTYRPYKNKHEMDAAVNEHGYYVVGINSKCIGIIINWNDNAVEISGYGTMSYIDFLKNKRWLYGSPCGVKKVMSMKTIEERADECTYANHSFCKKAYIEGATEQREIEIEKACELLCKTCDLTIDGIKPPECNDYPCRRFVEFRKAMKGK